MKKNLRRLLLFLAILTVFAVVRFPYDDYSQSISRTITDAAARSGVYLKAKSTTLSFPGRLDFENVGGIVPLGDVPVPIQIDDGYLKLRFLPFLMLRGAVVGTMHAYGGEIDLRGHQSLTNPSAEALLQAAKLQLAKHPLLGLNGISGELSLDASGVLPSQEALVEQLSLMASLENGSIDGKSRVLGLFPLPSVSEMTAQLQVGQEADTLLIRRCRVRSSIGSVSCQGSAKISAPVRITALKLNAAITLNASGVRQIGGYLALAAGMPPDSKISSWQLELESESSGRLRATVAPG